MRLLRSPRQRVASRRNLVRARQHHTRAHDTMGFWFRAGMRGLANAGTGGVASKANTWISGQYRSKPSKFFKNQSGKRRKR